MSTQVLMENWKIESDSGIPIYKQIIHQITAAIANGTLAIGNRLPTIRELNRNLGVNPNTVAKAYRELTHKGLIDGRRGFGSFVKMDRPVATDQSPVTPAIRQQLPQMPLPVPAWTARKQIALVQITRYPHGVDSDLSAGVIARRAAPLHLRAEVQYVAQSGDEQIFDELKRIAAETDGLLLYGQADLAVLNRLADQRVPFVVLGNPEGGSAILPRAGVIVTSDMIEMGRVATQRLIDLGHRRIGFLYGRNEPGMWGDSWLNGYRLAHHAAGLPLDRQLVDLWADDPLPGQLPEKFADWYLGLADPPTAYVVPDSSSVFVFLRDTLRLRGVELSPRQVSLGGRHSVALAYGLGDWPLVAEDMEALLAGALQQLRVALDVGLLAPARLLIPYKLYNFTDVTVPQPKHQPRQQSRATNKQKDAK